VLINVLFNDTFVYLDFFSPPKNLFHLVIPFKTI